MKRINIKDKLRRQRDKSVSGKELLQDIEQLLAADDKTEEEIHREITRGDTGTEQPNEFDLDLLDSEKIYHETHIKRICTLYRLRFLDGRLFKDDLPYEAIRKTKQLQKEHNTTLSGFKILAPAKCFRLKNADDPLLFAAMGNGYYYLVHKWGNDLHPLRKLMMWPMRNLECMIAFLFVTSLILTLLFPTSLFSDNLNGVEFLIIVFFMFKWVGGLAIYYLYKNGHNFSPAVWKSTYFNTP